MTASLSGSVRRGQYRGRRGCRLSLRVISIGSFINVSPWEPGPAPLSFLELTPHFFEVVFSNQDFQKRIHRNTTKASFEKLTSGTGNLCGGDFRRLYALPGDQLFFFSLEHVGKANEWSNRALT